MPDQRTALHLTPAERRSVKALTQTVNSCRPTFWREDSGVLMASTTGRSGATYLYRFNADESRWNDAGRVEA